MRRFITSAALVAASLVGLAGMADAKGFENGSRRTAIERRETPVRREMGHGPVVNRGGYFDGHYRDRDRRPERRIEHFGYRDGYRWHAGDWTWNGYEWIWVPGYYVRCA